MASFKTTVFDERGPVLDARLGNPRSVTFAYPLPTVATLAEAEARARQVRRRILVAAGLCPTPRRTPLRSRIWDRAELDGYTIEKVCFESRPGLLVTGNLFRPTALRSPAPAVLNPHGHWDQGRFSGGGGGGDDESVNVPARCAMLARLGFVVFSYDMIGYGDSHQFTHRPPADVVRTSLLYGIGAFGVQLWNSIRATDFLCRLPDVDAERIGCTGASGGATQAYYLAAVDDRIKVTVPVCMVSAHFQGGCSCEEPPLMHLGDLTTLDVVAALAPRPTLLVSITGDWTNQNPDVDFPSIRRVYALYGAADRIANVHFDAFHNYNQATREHMYPWFRRWLAGDQSVGRRIAEPKLMLPTIGQQALFPDGKPPRGFKSGQALLDALAKEESAAFVRPPASPAALGKLRSTWRSVYRDVFDEAEPDEPVSIGMARGLGRTDTFRVSGRALGRYGRGEQIPALWIEPQDADKRSPAALVVHEQGKGALFTANRPGPLLGALLGAGVRVLALDMLGCGETASLLAAERLDRDDPLFCAFNRSLAQLRVAEILIALAALRRHDQVRQPALIGVGSGAVAALLARPLAGTLAATVADLRQLPTQADSFWLGRMYHPFIQKLGGLRSAMALGPLSPLLLAGADPGVAAWARATFRLSDRGGSLRICRGELGPAVAAKWIKR